MCLDHPMAGNVPEWARGFQMSVLTGQAEIAQGTVIELCQGTALTVQGRRLTQAGKE